MVKPLRLAFAALTLVGACMGSEPTGVLNRSGDLGFTYTGPLSGTFSASGQRPQTTTEERTMDWASGVRNAADVSVDAAMPRSATTYDATFLSVSSTTTGSFPITAEAGVTVLLGAPVSGAGQAAQTCFLASGTVAITGITANRVTGTFSGSGSCLDPSATTTSFTLTGGSFDVALIQPAP